MSELLPVAQLRAVVQSALTDAELEAVIDDEEAELVRRLGPHGDGATTVVERVTASGDVLFVSRPVASVTSITSSGTAVSSALYTTALGGGQILHTGAGWPTGALLVTYVPADDQPRRRRVLIELVRLALEQTAFQGESVAGEHSYTAPNWEERRASLYRRLTYMSL